MLNTHIPIKLEQSSFCTAMFSKISRYTDMFFSSRKTYEWPHNAVGGGREGGRGRESCEHSEIVGFSIRVAFVELSNGYLSATRDQN